MDKNYGYKHTKGFLALIILVVIMIMLAPAFSQTISSTGNLVNNTTSPTTTTSTWQNGYYVNALTCWKGGDPNCSPGTPYVRSGSNINFSYSYTELYQNLSVAKALPNSGTGLVTTGYTFSWRSKNGNGWDNGNLDQLKAYVQGYTKSGQWIENYNYDLNFKHDWTDFTWNQNWSKDRRSSELSTVIFGFAGKDNNFWQGPYGPEVTNVNFQLKYKPDPCVNNPLYSADCPNFTEALQKNLTSSSINETSKVVTETESSNQITSTKQVTETSKDKTVVTTTSEAKEQKTVQVLTATNVKETLKNVQQNSKQTEQITQSIIPAVDISASTSQSNNLDKNIKEDKSQQSLTSFTSPISNNTTISKNKSEQASTVVIGVESNNISLNQDNVIKSQSIATSLNNNMQQQQTPVALVVQQPQKIITNNNLPPSSATNSIISLTSETPTIQSNFLTSKSDPLNTILENKPSIEERKQDTNTQQVKSNVQDNDAAAGVSIASIARTPVGFNTYLIALNDAAFYTPKEIYRNQKTIDNNRALRQLASDRLHQQMVDQQYSPR